MHLLTLSGLWLVYVGKILFDKLLKKKFTPNLDIHVSVQTQLIF